MKKSLSRTWEGNSIGEFNKAGIKAWRLLIKSSNMKDIDVFNSNTIYRRISIIVESDDREYKMFWNNEETDMYKFANLKNVILCCFNCKSIDSFQIYVRLVKR